MKTIVLLLILSTVTRAVDKQKLFLPCSGERSLLPNEVDDHKKSDGIVDEGEASCECTKHFGIVQKIVYNTHANLLEIPFSSMCIKCGLCVIVADKINETLTRVHGAMSPHTVQWLNDTQADDLLRLICNHYFHRYRLRENNGERYIGEASPGAHLIEISDDKLWELELKNKCFELIQTIGASNVYKYWANWFFKSQNLSLVTMFCRGDGGVFSDCRNFEASQDKKAAPLNEDASQRKINIRFHQACLL